MKTEQIKQKVREKILNWADSNLCHGVDEVMIHEIDEILDECFDGKKPSKVKAKPKKACELNYDYGY